MIRLLTILFAFGMFAGSALAQTEKTPYITTGFLYNKETVGTFGLTTNRGYFASYEVGKIKTFYKTSFFRVSLAEIKSYREVRQSADPSLRRSFRPYVLGKANNLFVARASWGMKRYYSEKARKKGVAVGASYAFGPSLGLVKPYQLALRQPFPDRPNESFVSHESYSDDNANVFLDPTRILGASSFIRGFDELSLVPGGHASVALHLDIGAFDDVVKALEIGAMLDVFPREIPILAEGDNQAFFLNFFVSLQFGKRK